VTRRPRKRGPGRPPLGAAARSRYVPIKLTPAEYERVKAGADAEEITVSEYARRKLLGPVD
jgi:hypothetical protein